MYVSTIKDTSTRTTNATANGATDTKYGAIVYTWGMGIEQSSRPSNQ